MEETSDLWQGVTDDDVPVYQTEHDWQGDNELSETIITAVATVTETESDNLPLLYNVVEPDALDAIFSPTIGMPLRQGGGCVSFTYNGCLVTAYTDGGVRIKPLSNEHNTNTG